MSKATKFTLSCLVVAAIIGLVFLYEAVGEIDLYALYRILKAA